MNPKKTYQGHNQYFKVMPLKNLPVSSLVGKKLYGGSKREEVLQGIDGRTPFFAAKGDSKAKIVPNSRISGVSGYRPTSREETVERAFANVLPYIKPFPDYVAWEEKYMAYRFSSRSIKMPYSAIKEKTVYPYFINAQQKVSDAAVKAIEQALPIGESSIRKFIPEKSLRLLSFEEAAAQLPATTNGGLPYMVSGTEVSQGKIERDNRPLYIKKAKHLAYQPLTDKDRLENAFISIWRGQESNDTKDRVNGEVVPKQRRPGAEGHAWTILGNRMKAFLEARKSDPRRSALVSQSKVDKEIHLAFSALKPNDWMLAWDGSNYDTWMMPSIASKICAIIIKSFNAAPQDLEACERYFTHVFSDPLVTPEGILGGEHGMPSGTTFTNELDSCYNELLSLAVQFLPQNINRLGIALDMVVDQGDDAVMVMTTHVRDISAEQFAEVISDCYKELNMSVNPKKQMISKVKTEFLKRLHTKHLEASYRSYVGSTIGMCNMEHSKAGKGPMYSARGIMQLANHYASLPGFDAFMKFASQGDEELNLGVGVKGGAYSIFQRAGGVDTVLKRLDMTSYATHLGVEHGGGEAKLADSLSSAMGVAQQNKKLVKKD